MKPKPSKKHFVEAQKTMIPELFAQWFWLRSADALTRFENDLFGQGYELLRRHCDFAAKPCEKRIDGTKIFQVPWVALNAGDKERFRFSYRDALVRLGLVFAPITIGTKAITFDCRQPVYALYKAAGEFINSATCRAADKADKAKQSGNKPELSLSERSHETNMLRQIAALAMPQPTNAGDSPREIEMGTGKQSYDGLAFGSVGPACELWVPKFDERPENDVGKPNTPRKFRCRLEDPSCPHVVTLLLPRKFVPIAEIAKDMVVASPANQVNHKKRAKRRAMYADEILAYFRSFLMKPPKPFAEHRRQLLRERSRSRVVEPRTITFGLIALDVKKVNPAIPFNALAHQIHAWKPNLLAGSTPQLGTGLANGHAACQRLFKRLRSKRKILP